MANTNCLEGVVCPKCGHEEMFSIVAIGTAVVKDSGAEVAGDLEWGRDSFISCHGCNHTGRLWQFSAEPVSARRVDLGLEGIVVEWDAATMVGQVTSDLRDDGLDADSPIGGVFDALESIILAHAVAGVDVGGAAYRSGVQEALEAIANNLG